MADELVFFWTYPSEEAEDHDFELVVWTRVQMPTVTKLNLLARSDIDLIEGCDRVRMYVIVLDLIKEGDN